LQGHIAGVVPKENLNDMHLSIFRATRGNMVIKKKEISGVCMWCVYVVCACGVCMWCVLVCLCACGVCLCACDVCMWCVCARVRVCACVL